METGAPLNYVEAVSREAGDKRPLHCIQHGAVVKDEQNFHTCVDTLPANS